MPGRSHIGSSGASKRRGSAADAIVLQRRRCRAGTRSRSGRSAPARRPRHHRSRERPSSPLPRGRRVPGGTVAGAATTRSVNTHFWLANLGGNMLAGVRPGPRMCGSSEPEGGRRHEAEADCRCTGSVRGRRGGDAGARRARSPRTRRGRSTGRARRRSIASSAYGDSIYAGYYGSIIERRQARRAVGRRRVPLAAVERRHRGDPAHQVGRGGRRTSTTTRSSPSARTCRRPTPASSPSRCAATTACRRAATSPARAGTCNYAPLDTALANCTTYQQLRDAVHQRQRLRGHDAEDRLEPLLPGLRRRQRAQQLQRPEHRPEGQQAEQVPALPRAR